jgi:hypothetical protein
MINFSDLFGHELICVAKASRTSSDRPYESTVDLMI